MWQPPAVQLRETSMMMNSRNVRRLQTERKEQGALLIILSRNVEELENIYNYILSPHFDKLTSSASTIINNTRSNKMITEINQS